MLDAPARWFRFSLRSLIIFVALGVWRSKGRSVLESHLAITRFFWLKPGVGESIGHEEIRLRADK